ncbi:hypothetical protein ACFX43_04655 [Nocardioides sp. YIM B13467]|uniref:hypothetical protein n=1 Tax=Nocardioides sp. YIM B13467 TaxID=3366294 RepID=UPI003671864C
MDDLNDDELKLITFLPAGLVVLTTALTAVGGLTGGIARMFRNSSTLAVVVLLVMLLAVLCALLAQLTKGWKAGLTRGLLVAGVLLFVLSLGGGMYMAVDTAKNTDRPNLSAGLTKAEDGQWTLEGTASASGLKASGSLLVYIYAYPTGDDVVRTKLSSAHTGPNAEGVATATFNVPLPSDQEYVSYVVTAAVGDEARFCEGEPIQVSAKLNEVDVPGKRDYGENNACVVLRPPPPTESTE